MNISEIEKLYEDSGLKDHKIASVQDLMKIYSIDYKIEGYGGLDDLNRHIYEKFIVNFFNGQRLESRTSLVPKNINWVEDIEYLVKENPEDEDFIVAGGVINAIDRNGLKTIHHKWIDEDYGHLKIKESETGAYLRFEYEHRGRKGWQHITDGGEEWY